MFKKHDMIILAAVILLALCSLLLFRLLNRESPAIARVAVDGNIIAEYPLNSDRTFTVNGIASGTVEVVISDGTVDVISASCPDKICVKHAPISRTGESIVCLPSRVVISVEGSTASEELDAVSQ